MIRRRTYNPSQLTDDELKASFIVRHESLEEMLNNLGTHTEGHPCEHMLLVGARGMGKTTLGLRFLQSIRNDSILAKKWQPVPFHEESYEIASLADFWLASLRHLSRATADDRWEKKADELTQTEPDQRRRESYALASLLDYCNVSGRRLVLFVENFDLIIQQMAHEREAHALRSVLIEHGELLLVGSANAAFDAIRRQDAPFYEFFRIIALKGLEREQCLQLFESIFERQETPITGGILAREQGRLETIRELTGGNPRLLVLAAQMLVESPLGPAFDDLEALVDEQTPYFKALIEALPVQARKVFHCLAGEWTPMLTREVAVRVNLSPSHTSAQMRQLIDRGYVRERRLPTEKRSRYEVADRFYNLYYLLRFNQPGRPRLLRLVAFLHDLYGEEGMPTLYRSVLRSLSTRPLPEAEFADWVHAVSHRVSNDFSFDDRSSWLEKAFKLSIEKLGATSSVVEMLTQLIGTTSVNLYIDRGVDLFKAKRFNDAESALRVAVSQERDFFALYFLGLVLVRLDRLDESLNLFGEVSAGVGTGDDYSRCLAFSSLTEQGLIHFKQGQLDRAAAMAENAGLLLSLGFPDVFRSSHAQLAFMTGVQLWKRDQNARAADQWKLVVETVRTDDSTELRLFAAKASRLRGEWLKEQGQLTEAGEALRSVRTLALTTDGPKHRDIALEAILSEGELLVESNRPQEATSVWLIAKDYLQSDDSSRIRDLGASSLCFANMVRSLMSAQDEGAVAETSKHVRAALDWAPDSPTVLQMSAWALVRMGKWEEPLALMEKAVAMLPESESLATPTTDTLIRIAAAGHMVPVREIMANTRLTVDLEPLWHAIRLELGEQIEPLPAEIMDATNSTRDRLVHNRR